MDDIFKERHAKLGCMVLKLFPKVMQMILKDYITPKGLQTRFSKNDFRLVFTKNEVVLMEKLPNIDDFTVEIIYKILRFEFNMLHEPECKWGNVPQDTDVEIADDIQRLINATNSIIKINSKEVTENFSENLLEDIKMMVTRIDSYLNQDDLGSLYNSLCLCEIDYISILQDLSKVKAIEESLPDTESDKGERYSRVSMAIIETFPNILRGVIQSIISASDVYQKCIPVLNTFYVEQQRNLTLLQRDNSYDSLDITLIYRLLRQFSLIPSPTQGWGSKPDKMDFKIGDDVERIRFYRNELAHRSDTNIDKTMFDEYFEQFRDIGNRMDLYINNNTNYEQRIIRHKICRMDAEMQAKYENTMRKMENIKLRYEKKPIKVYWGESFDKCLMNLRSLLKDEKLEGRPEIRVQIIFQKEDDIENNIEILNSLKEEINDGLSGIEFIVATKGSVVLNVDILLEMLETDEKLQTTLILFLEKILKCIPAFSPETIGILVLPVEENKQWNKPKTMEEEDYVEFDIEPQLFESDGKMIEQWNKPKQMGEQVYLEFDIEAQLFETDDSMVEQFRKISDVIIKHSKEGATNQNITLTILPIDLENVSTKEQSLAHAETLEENSTTTGETFAGAQTHIKYNLPVSVNLRRQLNLKTSNVIWACVKIGNKLVFADFNVDRLIVCNANGTDMVHIALSHRPWYLTEVDSNTVAISCTNDSIILILYLSTQKVVGTINSSGHCYGISYYDDFLYVDIDGSKIQVMDLTGTVLRTIPLPSYDDMSDKIYEITVERDRFVGANSSAIYCCSLYGKLIWSFKNEFDTLRCVTTDYEGNVYVTNERNHTVVVVSEDGKRYRKILTESDGLANPRGIYFDKKENLLMICSSYSGKVTLFDVKKKQK